MTTATPPGTSNLNSRWFPLGYLQRPHGVRGEIRLCPFDGLVFELDNLTHIRLRERNGTLINDFSVKHCRTTKDAWLLTLLGIDGRNEAALLKGKQVEVPFDSLPQEILNADYFSFELVGATVIDEGGLLLGTITQVSDNGTQELIEVDGENHSGLLLPLLDETFIDYQRDTHCLTLKVPTGLLELDD